MLLVGPPDVRKRNVAPQGHGRFLSLRPRRTFLLDGILHVAVKFKIYGLQSEQLVTGECGVDFFPSSKCSSTI